MTHKPLAPLCAESAKTAAHAIKARLDSLNCPIKLNHAFEAVAIAHRYPNWATMKAATATRPPIAQDTAGFHLGTYEEHGVVQISVPEALKHIHLFCMTEMGRRSLLQALARNALENGSAAIFLEPTDAESLRSSTVEQVMAAASASKRMQDFRVVDLSSGQTRLGDSFNILRSITDPMDAARLLSHAGGPQRYSHTRIQYIEAAASLALCMGELSITSIRRQLERMAKVESVPDYVGERKVDFSFNPHHHLDSLLCLDAAERKFGKFFDEKSTWMGPAKSLENSEILVVFTARDAGDLEDELTRVVTNQIRQSIMEVKRPHGAFPHMILSNDADDFTEDDIVSAARRNGTCLVIADQRPAPPRNLTTSTRFRNLGNDLNSVHWGHELLTDDGNTASTVRDWWFRDGQRR